MSTTSRVLRLLGHLQARRSWAGTELAERLGVSPRTIRRDVDRLRELGYRIAAERGSAGGYRLEAGSDLPPLLFTEDEAVALALGLRIGAAHGAVLGMADLTVSVLSKLEQVLPPAARARLRATQAAVIGPGPVHSESAVSPETFATLALACRDGEVVAFVYEAASGARTERRVEPVALVPVDRRWYLLGWDLARDDWRTFRLDRIAEPIRTREFPSRHDAPGGDAAGFVTRQLARGASPQFAGVVRIAAPLGEVEARIGSYTSGLQADGDRHTLWRIRDDRLELLAGALTWLAWPFTVIEGDELQQFLRDFAARAGL
ncbi:helix-turn-helix transcriptional regulator [Amnibacterium flavum]|nr:YafY family protein [Amnibacterium flavum]